MTSFDSNFFLNLDLESSEIEDATLETGFGNDVYSLFKDNSNYVQDLRDQMEAFKRLEKRNKN